MLELTTLLLSRSVTGNRGESSPIVAVRGREVSPHDARLIDCMFRVHGPPHAMPQTVEMDDLFALLPC